MHQAVVLWADALCINQSETDEALEEREVQVQLMHKIYSQAELVYVDLGEDVPEMEKVLQFLQKFDFLRFRTPREFKQIFHAFESNHLPDIEHSIWPDIVAFMRRPWFTRVWIMQEFVLAKHVQVVVGIRRLQYVILEWLALASSYYRSFSTGMVTKYVEEPRYSISYWYLLLQIEQGCKNLLSLVAARKNRQENKTDCRNFSTLLRRSKTFDATDKRDRAYALLSLADDIDNDMFPVRYKNETFDQTAQRVTRYLLVESDGRHVDGRAALYRTIGLDGSGPSWTYDLDGTVLYDGDVLQRIDDKGDSKIYQASAGGGHLEVSVTGTILTVRGYVLGSITQLSGALIPPEPGQDRPLALIHYLNWILGVARWATRIQRSSNTKLDVMAVWITAFAGYFWEKTLGEDGRYNHEDHPEISQQLSDFIEAVEEVQDILGDQSNLQDVLPSCMHFVSKMFPVVKMIRAIAIACNRRLAYTSDNLLALVPGSAEVGDVLSIFMGTPIPFVLRQAQGNYRLNGAAYIHNMMDGEVLRDPRHTVQNIDIC